MLMGIAALIVILAVGGFWYMKKNGGSTADRSDTKTAMTNTQNQAAAPKSDNPYEGKTVSVDYIVYYQIQ